MTEARQPVDELWSYRNVLRDDGVSTIESPAGSPTT
ncbi:hypothetical protein SAMN05216574_12021 [Blastococcus tunisiensis]|uniref:Uncharacterized protein n=1 Tax=Blastococcus tunisiensis TaxID=1798228 RepID=A0A1I2K8C5_9ACTN|nr:hypothetical protein SAMN05216574_12021 [Blastococcus sp. DSM 46838]